MQLPQPITKLLALCNPRRLPCFVLIAGCVLLSTALRASAGDLPSSASRGDRLVAEYFRLETQKLADACLNNIHSLEDWKARRKLFRQQLFEMLGLEPLPERTPLEATVTAVTQGNGFRVERLHFQSRPKLYVTANLYVPNKVSKPLPAILYLCGHGRVKRDGISYGNKVHYHHHGAWFARHGYVCLTIDTLQLGEIEGLHHGTYREGMWWWNSRGYTPAGVEAWNSIRALDYLETRPEVDASRIGVTGRSGGGAYTWWVAALDDRVRVAVPVAGITDLTNHVVDGCVEGHCDCMYLVNTYRWDYPLVAALVAPRPLLICNSDKDSIFPLDGVVRLHEKVRRIYALYGAEKHLGLHITEGPHRDTQELRVGAFHWFNRFLKNDDPLIDTPATPCFEPPQLKVFEELPTEQRNTTIHEQFTAKAPTPPLPDSPQDWAAQRHAWIKALAAKSLAGWPQTTTPPQLKPVFSQARDGLRLRIYQFESQTPFRLQIHLLMAEPAATPPKLLVLHVQSPSEWPTWQAQLRKHFPKALGALPAEATPSQTAQSADASDAKASRTHTAQAGTSRAASSPSKAAREKSRSATGATSTTNSRTPTNGQSQPTGDSGDSVDLADLAELKSMLAANGWVVAYFAPRGIGPTAWNADPRKQTHIRRRFMLLGQTLDGMRIWDVRRAIEALKSTTPWSKVPLWLEASDTMAGIALYAALFAPGVERLDLWRLPASHREGPTLLNVLRILDTPQVVAMACQQHRVRLYDVSPEAFSYARQVVQRLHWPDDHLQFVQVASPSPDSDTSHDSGALHVDGSRSSTTP